MTEKIKDPINVQAAAAIAVFLMRKDEGTPAHMVRQVEAIADGPAGDEEVLSLDWDLESYQEGHEPIEWFVAFALKRLSSFWEYRDSGTADHYYEAAVLSLQDAFDQLATTEADFDWGWSRPVLARLWVESAVKAANAAQRDLVPSGDQSWVEPCRDDLTVQRRRAHRLVARLAAAVRGKRRAIVDRNLDKFLEENPRVVDPRTHSPGQRIPDGKYREPDIMRLTGSRYEDIFAELRDSAETIALYRGAQWQSAIESLYAAVGAAQQVVAHRTDPLDAPKGRYPKDPRDDRRVPWRMTQQHAWRAHEHILRGVSQGPTAQTLDFAFSLRGEQQ